MRVIIALLSVVTFSLSAQPQPRGGAGPANTGIAAPGALFGGGMARLFTEIPGFSATMQIDAKSPNGPVSIPGKVSFLNGKSRFEMDATQMKGASMPAAAVEQIRSMGMAEVQSITIPEKKEAYLVYPGLKSYAVVPLNGNGADEKIELTKKELGKETVDGHPATKYKVTVKGSDGNSQDATVWLASDLKNFPVKIQTVNEGSESTVTFKDVSFKNPEASLFSPPADFQRYSDATAMMREAMMKRFARPGVPPANPAK